MDNVDEYIDLSYKFFLETGIRRQMEALRDGFCRVFPMSKLSAFTPNEIRLMLCGDQNPHWTREDLLNYTDPKLGYTKERYVLIYTCTAVKFFGRFSNRNFVHVVVPDSKDSLTYWSICRPKSVNRFCNLQPDVRRFRPEDWLICIRDLRWYVKWTPAKEVIHR